MLKIGIFSKLSRISVRMLRYYDEAGLLAPGEVDPSTGYRYYHERQLMEAERIRALREMGFGVEAVREMLGAEARRTQERLTLLETTLQRVRKDGIIVSYNVTRKEIPQRQVASLRGILPDYSQEGELWRQMMEEAGPQNLQMADPCWSMAIFHDQEYKEENVEVEIQMAVKGEYRDTEHVRFFTASSQEVASVTCRGSYQQMNEVNQALAGWIAANGYEISGPMFNIYHVGPAQTPDPDQWVTEVCLPVRKK